MKISKYRPEFVFFDKINKNFISKKLNGYNNFSSGKSCINYLCNYYNLKNKKIIIPSYICSDVVDVLLYNNCNIIFAEVNTEDLNISFQSIVDLVESEKDIFAVLIASLYGNACDVKKIDNFCKKKNILLLNDCCQSYGAKIENICITEFGDASFFSFSPGKNLSGFAGGYLKIKDDNSIIHHKYTNNIYYLLSFIIFFLNRILIDRFYTMKLGNFFLHIRKKLFNYDFNYLANLNLPLWVTNYNLKLIYRQELGKFSYKNDYILSFPSNKYFTIIKSVRGKNVSFRLVLLFFNIRKKENFVKFLKSKSVYFSTGYKSYSNQKIDGIKIDNLIVNIPIEKNEKLRKFVSKSILEWLNVN